MATQNVLLIQTLPDPKQQRNLGYIIFLREPDQLIAKSGICTFVYLVAILNYLKIELQRRLAICLQLFLRSSVKHRHEITA